LEELQIRRDWFSGRTSVIAKGRGARPHLFRQEVEQEQKACPFCRGNETMTPPAELVLRLPGDGQPQVLYDEEARDVKDWQVRSFPNLFPAFRPTHVPSDQTDSGLFAYGYHMILVDSPSHGGDLDSFTDIELRAYLTGLRLIKDFHESDERIKCTSIFKNHGREAGASIPHPHTQIISSEFIPQSIRREFDLDEEIRRDEGRQAISKLLEEAEEAERVVFQNKHFTAFTPFAPISPYEFWIAPTEQDIDWKDEDMEFGKVLRMMIHSMKKLLGQAPYNFYLHLPPKDSLGFRWHLECVPRVNTFAGYELGFETYIITQFPEESAKSYKEQIPRF